MAKSNSEKIETINRNMASTEKEIRQMENRMKRLSGEQSQLERKARTRRLIERGAMLESLIPEAETLTNEQIQSILFAVFHTDIAREVLQKTRASANTDSSLA